MGRRAVTLVTATLTVASLFAPLEAAAQVPAGEADFRASATGAAIHAELVEQGELSSPTSSRLVDVDEAFSAAVVDSAGLPERQTNEYGGTVQPVATADGTDTAGANAFGMGFGLDVSLQQEGQAQGQLTLAGLADALAPPPTELAVNEIGPVPADPVAYAALLRGEARALYDAEGPCVSLGSDIAYGKGLAADVQLLDQGGDNTDQLDEPILATEAEGPEREVASSVSRTYLAPQTAADGTPIGQAYGLVAETRQTLAPVTLFQGTANELTIEFLGEWVLRAVATGLPGSARVHYGPGEASPSTPLVRLIQGGEVTDILTTQDLFGDEGLVIDASPVVSIALGEDPRAIGGDVDSTPAIAADGTSAAGAVDVVRVRLLSQDGTGEVSEIRVGHMEVSATVPAGGLLCGLPVTKSVDRPQVAAGESFTYTITVTNTFDCELLDIRVVDTISADPGVVWSVTGTDPAAESMSDQEVVWTGLGPLPPGESLSVSLTVEVSPDSAGGAFLDRASATGTCEDVPITGTTQLPEPEVTALDLPKTGGPLPALLGLTLLGGAAALLRRRR